MSREGFMPRTYQRGPEARPKQRAPHRKHDPRKVGPVFGKIMLKNESGPDPQDLGPGALER